MGTVVDKQSIEMFSSNKSSSEDQSPTSANTFLWNKRQDDVGKSMPMMETFTDYSMVAVYKTKGELKFVHVKSEKYIGRFTVLIFMDDKLSELEIEEWKDFSDHVKEFKQAGASVLGVCTDSHISMRTMIMKFFPELAFPIISDRDGDFSRSFGLLKLKNGEFGAARALVILDTEGRMVHLSLHNENTRSYPDKVLSLIKHLKNDVSVSAASDDVSTESVKSAPASIKLARGLNQTSKGIKYEDNAKPVEEKNSGGNEGNEEKEYKTKDIENKNPSKMNKDTKEKETANLKKNSDDKKSNTSSKHHKKPSCRNLLEAGAPLSQD